MRFLQGFLCVLLSFLIAVQSFPTAAYAQDSGSGSGIQTTNNADRSTTIKFEGQEVMIGGEIQSTLVIWGAALVSMMIISMCMTEGSPCGIGAISAGLAGAALLAGEIIAIIDYQRSVDEIAVNMGELRKYKTDCEAGNTPDPSLTNGRNPCDQLESIRAQKESFEKMKSALETKGNLYIAGAAAYLLAGIVEAVAAIEEASSNGIMVAAYQNCATNATIQANTLSAQTGRQADAAICTACATACTTAAAKMGAIAIDESMPEPATGSTVDCTDLTTQFQSIGDSPANACTGICAAAHQPVLGPYGERFEQLITCRGSTCPLGCTTQPTVGSTTSTSVPKYSRALQKVMDSLIQTVHAQESAGRDTREGESQTDVSAIVGSILKFAGAAVGILLGLFKVWAFQVDNFFGKPIERMIIYGVMAALAGWMAGYTLGFQMDVVNKNIEKLDRLLNMSSPQGAGSPTTSSSIDTLEGFSYKWNPEGEIPLTENPDLKFPCINGGDGKGNCIDAKEATEFNLQRLNLSNLAGISGSARTLERSMSGKSRISPQGLHAARDLARAHSGLKKQFMGLKKQVNDNFAARGIAPVDFEGHEGNIRNALGNAANDLIAKNGGSDLLGKMAANLPASSVEQMEKKLSGEEKASLGGSPAFVKFTEDSSGFTFDGLGNDNEANLEIEPEQDFSGSTVKDEGIVDNKTASIFDVISVRYLKSAFSRLFDEEK